MKEIYGDLLTLAESGEFDVIVHGQNCFHNMGAGIANSIRIRFGEAYVADKQSEYGSGSKLGTYTSALIYRNSSVFTVVNAYTQYSPKTGKLQCDYRALRNVFKHIKHDFSGKRIGYPLIGAGLAGGDWNVISQIIDEELHGETHTLVRYQE